MKPVLRTLMLCLVFTSSLLAQGTYNSNYNIRQAQQGPINSTRGGCEKGYNQKSANWNFNQYQNLEQYENKCQGLDWVQCLKQQYGLR